MLSSCAFRLNSVTFFRHIQSCGCKTSPKDNEIIPPAKMPWKLTEETDITSKNDLKKLVEESGVKWRTPWHQKEGQHYSALRSFYEEENNSSILKIIQAPINVSPTAIKNWWTRKQEEKNIFMQQYIPERNQILGNELAAAHFIVHRAGAVKFFGEDKWIKADENNSYNLPRHYLSDKILQAVDCSYMKLHYEGLVNLKDLRKVEWLSVNSCEHMDDWCMDRIGNIFSETLLYLDIRDCPDITERGLGCLHKLKNLKILYVDDILKSSPFELTCLMLQELNPALDIRTN